MFYISIEIHLSPIDSPLMFLHPAKNVTIRLAVAAEVPGYCSERALIIKPLVLM